ncbi:MAG: aldehyde dehydrogenase [Bdellovibrionota bacterium]
MKKILNFIDGKFCEPKSQKYLDNYNPSRGEVYSLVPNSDSQDVLSAIDAATKAFPAWSSSGPEVRAGYLRKIANKINEQLNELALAESIDNGKPITVSKTVDIPRSARNFEFFADILSQFRGETFRSDASHFNTVEFSPLGVVSCISPWNLPLYLFTWKIAPALAAGNTVVAKPSELTPMTAFLLSEICASVGLPAGVLNIVHGLGTSVGEVMTTDPRVKAISFTGSTATGRTIAQKAALGFKKISLEMGGKNANIIFADANFEKALSTTVRSSFSNQGQICLCGSRIFIQKSIYEKFKLALVEKTLQLKLGDPMDESIEQGALVSAAHRDKVQSFIKLAENSGAQRLTGGQEMTLSDNLKNGYFVSPTLLEGLSYEHEVNQEEIFGPVATLIPFETEEEVLRMANSTRYGLAASVWTQDLTKANRVAQKIEAGVVWVNTWMYRDLRTPFGGMKESGVGREGGVDALKFFSEVKNICVSTEESL